MIPAYENYLKEENKLIPVVSPIKQSGQQPQEGLSSLPMFQAGIEKGDAEELNFIGSNIEVVDNRANITTIIEGISQGHLVVGAVITTLWIDDVVIDQTGGIWLKANGQIIDIEDYPDLIGLNLIEMTNVNSFPYLTSNDTPEPFIAQASSETRPAWRAFDGLWSSHDHAWTTYVNQAQDSWIVIGRNDEIKTKTDMVTILAISGFQYLMFTEFRIEGSNDLSNWDILLIVTDANFSTNSLNSYKLNKIEEYVYYRLFITNPISDNVSLYEITYKVEDQFIVVNLPKINGMWQYVKAKEGKFDGIPGLSSLQLFQNGVNKGEAQKLNFIGSNINISNSQGNIKTIVEGISDFAFPVGMILPTAWIEDSVVDIAGGIWLQMNGQIIFAEDYPDLVGIGGITISLVPVTPIMTGYSSPEPWIVKESGSIPGMPREGWKIFDRVLGDGNAWAIHAGSPQWVSIHRTDNMKIPITSGKIFFSGHAANLVRGFDIEGSNDEIEWDLLYSVSGLSSTLVGQNFEFTLTTPGNHVFYRIMVTDSSPHTSIDELYLGNELLRLPDLPKINGFFQYIKATKGVPGSGGTGGLSNIPIYQNESHKGDATQFNFVGPNVNVTNKRANIQIDILIPDFDYPIGWQHVTSWVDEMVITNSGTWLRMWHNIIDIEDFPELIGTTGVIGYGSKRIHPLMTSNIAPKPVIITASSVLDSTYNFPWQAFNGWIGNSSTNDGWASAATFDTTTLEGEEWIKIDMGFLITIDKYIIRNRGTTNNLYSPSTWILEGSNDDINWTVIDFQENIPQPLYNYYPNTFQLSEPQTYRFYKITITKIAAWSVVPIVLIGELEFFNTGYWINDIPLVNGQFTYIRGK